jgi:hypothetical protein
MRDAAFEELRARRPELIAMWPRQWTLPALVHDVTVGP